YDATAVSLRARMKDCGLITATSTVQAADLTALYIVAWIAAGRHNDAQGGFVMPAEIEMREIAVGGCDECGQQIGLQAHHQGLAFRIAEPDVDLDQLRPVRPDH